MGSEEKPHDRSIGCMHIHCQEGKVNTPPQEQRVEALEIFQSAEKGKETPHNIVANIELQDPGGEGGDGRRPG